MELPGWFMVQLLPPSSTKILGETTVVWWEPGRGVSWAPVGQHKPTHPSSTRPPPQGEGLLGCAELPAGVISLGRKHSGTSQVLTGWISMIREQTE